MYKIPDGTAAPTLGGGGVNEGSAFAFLDLDTANKVEIGNFSARVDGTEPDGLDISKGQKIAFSIDSTNNMMYMSVTISFAIASNWDE
jgi:hypothetical protein